MPDPNTFTTKEQWYDWVNSDAFNVTPPPNKAVFHSGVMLLNYSYAEKWCDYQAKGHVTIERVGDGKMLNQAKLYEQFPDDRKAVDEIWKKASERYAKAASGAVICFVRRDEADSIFRTVELPALLKNDKVTFINGIPREQLKSLYDRDKSKDQRESLKEIHEQITQAEPRQLTPSKPEQDRLLSQIKIKEVESDKTDKRHFEATLPSEKRLIFEVDSNAKGVTLERLRQGITFEKLVKMEAKPKGEIITVKVKQREQERMQ